MLFRKKKSADNFHDAGRRRPDVTESRPVNPKAFSYYSRRSLEQTNVGRRESADASKQMPDRRPNQSQYSLRNRLMYSGLAVMGIAAGAYFVTLSSNPDVVLRQTSATAYFLQDKTVYQQSAERILNGSFFNKNKVTVDSAGVSVGLLKSYPELKSAVVEVPLLSRRPIVTIEPFQPSFILTTTGSNAFLLDATGRALATTTQISNIDEIDVPTLQDRTGVSVMTGRRALPSKSINFTQTVVAALKSANMTVSALILPAAANELDVFISGKPYFVKFNLQEDALQQAGTYIAVQERLEKDKIKPGEYVDVRVPERAYYR